MKPIYLVIAIFRHIKVYLNIKVFQKRFFILRKTGKSFEVKKQQENILVVIAHVVADAANAPQEKIARLIACMDALGIALGGFNFKIVLLTKKEFSLHERLPGYLKHQAEVYYSQQQDPMFVEYDTYDVFKRDIESYDYFMFLEDDIILSDSWFLEKIKKFNHYSSNKKFVLLPHRFEYANGIKHYIDQTIMKNETLTSYKFSDIFNIELDGAKFTIYENSHSAFYCLGKEQMQLWVSSGNTWKNKVVAFGVLESAATFSLYENFQFFKPHPDNIEYFEVQHFGNKYISYHKLDKATSA